jgi:hypothetical protein
MSPEYKYDSFYSLHFLFTKRPVYNYFLFILLIFSGIFNVTPSQENEEDIIVKEKESGLDKRNVIIIKRLTNNPIYNLFIFNIKEW